MFSQDEAIQKPQADKKKIEIQYKTWLQKKKNNNDGQKYRKNGVKN